MNYPGLALEMRYMILGEKHNLFRSHLFPTKGSRPYPNKQLCFLYIHQCLYMFDSHPDNVVTLVLYFFHRL